jgi:hypothetical protein
LQKVSKFMGVSKISQKKNQEYFGIFFHYSKHRDGMLSAKVSSSEFQQTSREE